MEVWQTLKISKVDLNAAAGTVPLYQPSIKAYWIQIGDKPGKVCFGANGLDKKIEELFALAEMEIEPEQEKEKESDNDK